MYLSKEKPYGDLPNPVRYKLLVDFVNMAEKVLLLTALPVRLGDSPEYYRHILLPTYETWKRDVFNRCARNPVPSPSGHPCADYYNHLALVYTEPEGERASNTQTESWVFCLSVVDLTLCTFSSSISGPAYIRPMPDPRTPNAPTELLEYILMCHKALT